MYDKDLRLTITRHIYQVDSSGVSQVDNYVLLQHVR